MKNKILSLIMIFLTLSVVAQVSKPIDTSAIIIHQNIKFNSKQLIIPAVLIGYGAIGSVNNDLKRLNLSIRNQIVEQGYKKTTVDNYIQYVPALSVYALNNLGIKGKNNLKDRSVILGTSLALVFVSVTAIKHIANVERPDGTNFAFPSGHTAMAFSGAEFLYQEYKDVSIWYGVGGYAIATTTGALRIYNNKHWLTDVAAGAGIGILCTKAAYWLNPFLNEKIFNRKASNTTTMFTPYYDGKIMGGELVLMF